MAQNRLPPGATSADTTSVRPDMGSVTVGSESRPQHSTVPLVRTAQEALFPGSIWRMPETTSTTTIAPRPGLLLVPSPSSPLSFVPQHLALSSLNTAQLFWLPTATLRTF